MGSLLVLFAAGRWLVHFVLRQNIANGQDQLGFVMFGQEKGSTRFLEDVKLVVVGMNEIGFWFFG
jgi:hypothetical protein